MGVRVPMLKRWARRWLRMNTADLTPLGETSTARPGARQWLSRKVIRKTQSVRLAGSLADAQPAGNFSLHVSQNLFVDALSDLWPGVPLS